MDVVIFARFRAKEGAEAAVETALREVQAPTRAEPGCIAIQLYRSVRDPRLFYVQSRWRDMAAFDRHADLPHTRRMITCVAPLIDHPLDVTRATLVS